MPTIICEVCGKPWMDTKYNACPTCASGGPRHPRSTGDSSTRGGPAVGHRVERHQAMKELARQIEVDDAIKDLRNGALLIIGFIALPIVLSLMFGGDTMVAVAFPVLWGIVLCIRGGIALARAQASN